MRTLKLKAQVTQDHTLRVDLPVDVKEGPAEVIVLLPDEPHSKGQSLEEYLAQLAEAPRSCRSVEAIDRALAIERESWS